MCNTVPEAIVHGLGLGLGLPGSPVEALGKEVQQQRAGSAGGDGPCTAAPRCRPTRGADWRDYTLQWPGGSLA